MGALGEALIVAIEISTSLVVLIAEVLTSIWFITLIADSFLQVQISLNLPEFIDLPSMRLAWEGLSSLIGKLPADTLATIAEAASAAFAWVDFDFVLDLVSTWNCDGVKALLSWVVLVLMVGLLYVVFKKELMFIVQIRWLRYRRKMGHGMRIMWGALVKGVASLLLYTYQLMVLLMYKVIVFVVVENLAASQSLASDSGSGGGEILDLLNSTAQVDACDTLDRAFRGMSFWLVVATLLLVLVVYLQLMGAANRRFPWRDTLRGALTLPLFVCCRPCVCSDCCQKCRRKYPALEYNAIYHSIKRVFLMTFGIWTQEMCHAYDVQRIAAKYDDDDTDDDSRHEDVVSILGRTRGLLWLLAPGCVVLTKIAQMANNPVVFMPRSKGYTGLAMRRPFRLRLFMWACNLTRIVSTIVFVFKPKTWILYLMLGSIVPSVTAEMVWRMRKSLEQKRREDKEGLDADRIRKQKHGKYARITYNTDLVVDTPYQVVDIRGEAGTGLGGGDSGLRRRGGAGGRGRRHRGRGEPGDNSYSDYSDWSGSYPTVSYSDDN